MTNKKRKEDEPPKGVKGEQPVTNSNHASEEDKGSEYSPDEVQGIKKELVNLHGDALYRKTLDLVNGGKLTPEQWHAVNYQESVYNRLRDGGFDRKKLIVLNAKYRIAIGVDGKDKSDESVDIQGYKLFFGDPVPVNPALDILPTGELITTVPFVADHEITTNKGTLTKREMVNIVISSNREMFPCVESEFSKRDLFAVVPETLLRQRWSGQARRAFISGNPAVDPFSVFAGVRDVFTKYIDFGENKGAAAFCTIYAILSYFFVLFDTIPYLKFEGMKGSGKSKAGTIFAMIGFNALMAVSMTPASIFRTVQEERSTLIIDEAENYGAGSDAFQEIMPILNSGWQKTGIAPRIEGNSGKRKRVNYSTYSPKIICAINPVFETLLDRSYQIDLIRTLEEGKANLSIRQKDSIWRELRDSLYLMLFSHYEEVRELADSDQVENDLKLIGRDWDKAKPIVTIMKFISKYAGDEGEQIRTDIMDFLTGQVHQEEEYASDSIEATIIQALDARINAGLEALIPEKRSDRSVVTVQLLDFSLEVASLEGLDTASSRFNKKSYTKKIARKLKSMGLRRNPRVNRSNLAIFDCTPRDIRLARKRYKVDGDMNTNQTNQTNQFSTFDYAQEKAENSDSSLDAHSLISLISQKTDRPMDPTDSKLCKILQETKGKRFSIKQISDSWSIVTEPKDIPALTEIYSRMTQLAGGKDPNVKMANDKFYWEESK